MSNESTTDKNFNSFNQETDEIDPGKFFRFILMQSKLVIAITAIGFITSLTNNTFQTKQYAIKSLLQYESVNGSIFGSSNIAQSPLRGSQTDISNLITLYKSRTNFLKLIKDLNLNIDVKGLSDNENIDINIKSEPKNYFVIHNLNFSFSNNGYAIVDTDKNELAYANYGEHIYFNELEILINSSNISQNKIVEVDYRNPESMYNYYKSKFVLSELGSRNSYLSKGGLISVSFTTDDKELGKSIVNYANEIFLNQRISVETEKSRKALDFINTNLKSLQNDFENKKIKLNRFREKNQSIDVDLEIQNIINKVEALDRSASSLDLAIARARDVYTENNTIFLNLLNEKKIIERQREDVISAIKLMPQEQQEYIDLFNAVEVSRALFQDLESRRLGFSILEASTIGDIRIVDKAYYFSQVSPKFSSVILFTFLSLLVGFVVAIIRGFLFLRISNPAELVDNNIHIPILAVIPKSNNINVLQDVELNSSIESLIVSIDSMNDNQMKNNIIVITSPGPHNGKSTTAIMLAQGYAELGKKVLLIDGDYKRGELGKNFTLSDIDKEKFISIDETSIQNFAINKNLYVIPRVKKLHNSFEFTYNTKFKQKIDFFKDYFDYVIVDTAPILSVTDTSILIEKSDFNILITRHAVNRISEIRQSVTFFEQIGKKIDGIVYNAYNRPNSYFGYYGIYGNYSYKYYAEKYLNQDNDYKK